MYAWFWTYGFTLNNYDNILDILKRSNNLALHNDAITFNTRDEYLFSEKYARKNDQWIL